MRIWGGKKAEGERRWRDDPVWPGCERHRKNIRRGNWFWVSPNSGFVAVIKRMFLESTAKGPPVPDEARGWPEAGSQHESCQGPNHTKAMTLRQV